MSFGAKIYDARHIVGLSSLILGRLRVGWSKEVPSLEDPDETETITVKGPVFVNIYDVDKAYGGPEEGGWWYEYGVPVASIPVKRDATKHEIHQIATQWAHYCNDNNRGRPSMSSVASQGEYLIYIENHFAKEWPEQTPRFE